MDDCQNGLGKAHYSDGDQYYVEFKGGKANREGSAHFAEEDRYIGLWKDGEHIASIKTEI